MARRAGKAAMRKPEEITARRAEMIEHLEAALALVARV
jgi:hypothetical protein